MQKITELLKEITYGFDGLIRKIEISNKFEKAYVIISAKENKDGKWINVAFKIDKIIEFCVQQREHYCHVVISFGIAYRYVNNLHYISFFPYDDEEDDEVQIKKSEIYFVAKELDFEKLPYEEW